MCIRGILVIGMSISPFYILIVYVIAVAVFVFLGILNIYHVIRFSYLRATSIVMSLLFLIGIVSIVLGTLVLLKDISWNEPIHLSIPLSNTINVNTNEEFEQF